MTKILGTNIVAPVVPFDTADTFPTHDAIYGRGGYRTVATLIERDAIPSERLDAGMVVYVVVEGKDYRWSGGAWSAVVVGPQITDELPEGPGATNLWFTEPRVMNSLMPGPPDGALPGPVAMDDLLSSSIYKLQAQIDAIPGSVGADAATAIAAHNSALNAHQDIWDLATGLTVVINSNVTATQTNTLNIAAAQSTIDQHTTSLTTLGGVVDTKANAADVATSVASINAQVLQNTSDIQTHAGTLSTVAQTVATKADSTAVASLTITVDNSVTQIASNTVVINQHTTDISSNAVGVAIARNQAVLMSWSNQGLAVDPVDADKVVRPLPIAGTIVRVAMYGLEGTGSCVVSLKKVSHANFGSAGSVSITGGTPPTISAGQKSEDVTLTGWTTAFAAGDVLIGEVVSCTGFRQIVLLLEIQI